MGAVVRILLLLLVFLFAIPLANAKPSVSDIRIGVHPDKTRFVLELSEEPAYRVFTLPRPYRVVVDLPELEWNLPQEMAQQQGGLIKTLRYGLFAPGTSRVVLDSQGPLEIISVFLLPPNETSKHRLVIDMKPVAANAFAATQQPYTSSKPLPKPKAVVVRSNDGVKDSRVTIVLDPGHGGVDPGTIGVSGIYEKEVVLTFTRDLKEALDATGRYNVLLTRDRDIFVKLADRRETARQAGADLFISIHADAHSDRSLRGSSVYTLSETSSDEVAAQLAATENKADLIAGVELEGQPDEVSSILLDLTQRETMNLSAQFATMLVEELKGKTRLLGNTHRFAGFVVLKAHDVPSLLIELGFLSNSDDEQRLRSQAERKKLVTSIASAVDRYFFWQQSMR